ncbi:SMI1/KNR4 family protein [Gottfriedia acidiceleris]|uniref:SMI1/KNR4 family protein n=1 Tax=Gottfriedia acidiceleris TaxID=371036 RepID=UPI002FFFE172
MNNSIRPEENDLYQLEPIRDEMVKKAEKKFDIILPNKYIEILKQQNGGMIKYNSFHTEISTS